jgi:exoribonuclease II
MYGIIRFTSKTRVNYGKIKGIEFIEYKSNAMYIVKTKKEYPTDRWAKVNPMTMELIEIIGITCDYNIESNILKCIYGIEYKYPKEWDTINLQYNKNTNIIDAYTVDNISTTDRDDAISIQYHDDNNHYTIGIHIIDLVRMMGSQYYMLYCWAKQYVVSAYWEEPLELKKCMKGIFSDHIGNQLSLTKDNIYPCLSLLLTYRDNILIDTKFMETNVRITNNMTYEEFSNMKDMLTLRQLTNIISSEEVVAWCMVQYNMYMAKQSDMLLRVQTKDNPAYYDYEGTHAHFNNMMYTHATSPIRRFADFYNQMMYHNMIKNKLSAEECNHINMRMREVKEFQQRMTIISLAYQCKIKPIIVSASIVRIEEEHMIRIVLDKRQFKIPIYDSYYAEEISHKLEEGTEYNMELFGLHKNGKATLRIRLL